MKKFLLILALLFGFFGKIFGALACALPPDILHEFRIDASENPVKIEYSLMTWDNLKPQVLTTQKIPIFHLMARLFHSNS